MNHEPLTTRWMRFCGNVQLVTKSLTLAVIGFAFLFGKIRDVPWGLVSFLSGLAILIAAFLRLLIDFGQMEVRWSRYSWALVLLALFAAALVAKPR